MTMGRSSCFMFLAAVVVCLSGCDGLTSTPGTTSIAASNVRGSIHGGQQPVNGATVQFWAVGTTGDGSMGTPLGSAVPSDKNGAFNLTTPIVCPDSDPLVYVTATGGDPGMGAINSSIVMMAALSDCNSLSASTFIQLNEVTTVAAVAALAPFMSAPNNVGSSPADAAALNSAFQLASTLADVSTGTAPGPTTANSPIGDPATVPVSEIYSLANVVAACVNSGGGTATDTTTACGKLESLTGGTSNTLTAIIALEKSPSAFDTTSIFNIALADAVFQPTLPQPPDSFAIGVSYTPTSTDYAVVPQTFYPGETVYFYWTKYPVDATDTICLASGLGQQAWFGYPYSNFITQSLIQARFYGSGGFIGEAGCGRLGGVTPTTGLSYGPIGVMTETYNNGYHNGVYMVMNVVPPPDQSLTFDKTTLFSSGGTIAAQYGQTADLRNNTSSPVTLGQVRLSGTNASAFTIDQDTCSGVTLQPYAQSDQICTIAEHYNPQIVNGGLIQASMTVSDVGNTLHATAIVAGIGYPEEN
jgi:hypothetical protein